MTIKVTSQSTAANAATSLFRQPGAQGDTSDLFASLLAGLGDTLLTDPKTGLLGDDAALSPLARKLKAAKAGDQPQQSQSDLNAMLGAAALLPQVQQALAQQLNTQKTVTGQEGESRAGTGTPGVDPALLAAIATHGRLNAQAGAEQGNTSDGKPQAQPGMQALANALGQKQGEGKSAEVQASSQTAAPAEVAATGQKTRPEAADFTQTLREAAAQAAADTPAPVAADGRQIQVAVPSAQRGAPQHVVSIPTPVGQPQWTDDVGQQVVVMMNAKLETAQLQVTPPDMGPVEISLKIGSDGAAQVSFVAGVAETRQALEQGMPRLSAMLADNGIRLADAQVSSGQGQAFRDNTQFAQQGQQGGGQSGHGQQSGHVPGSQDQAVLMNLPDSAITSQSVSNNEVSIYA
ncbi:flagellar hook-length control protein FliK [Rivihabitans pingtungensis]|uniref:Flagellar hook-length control protein FliK n=1 Tax=Rivihabitans pingtungensis TaxID=1054498 RepID=A0A318KMF4_9NEIS|nr:flagellar hook-length control protein FliK [Rivihabitans pingtungensis]PXX77632.1 flagellar hook-length control protein FliK [Rivihabitans pingtungensis]